MHGGAAGVIFGMALLLEGDGMLISSKIWARRQRYVLCRKRATGSVFRTPVYPLILTVSASLEESLAA